MKLIQILLIALLAITCQSAALTACNTPSNTPEIVAGTTTLADTTPITQWGHLITCLTELVPVTSQEITKITITANGNLDATGIATIGTLSGITNIASSFEVVATFKTIAGITATQLITNFFDIIKADDSNISKFTFITDKVIDFPSFAYMRELALETPSRLGSSEFSYTINGSDQAFTGLTDATSFQQFDGKELSLTAAQLTTGCTAEDAIYTTLKITAVTPATGGADIATCLGNINESGSLLKVLHINLSGATGLLDNGSQMNLNSLLSNVRGDIEEIEIDMSSVTFVSSLSNFYPNVGNNFTALRKYKADYTKNGLDSTSDLSTHLLALRDLSIIDLEVVFQGQTTETNALSGTAVATLVDNFLTYSNPNGSTERSINRKLFISDGFKICEPTYTNGIISDDCEWTTISIIQSELYPMNCAGETLQFSVQVDQSQATGTDFDNNAFSWSLNKEYFDVPFDSAAERDSFTIDLTNFNADRQITVSLSAQTVQKGTTDIPYVIDGSETFTVYQCMPRANILVNGQAVQEEYTNCQDLEFTIQFDNVADASLIVPETHFSWTTALNTYDSGYDQNFIIRSNELIGANNSIQAISVTVSNTDILVRPIRFELNQCQATSTILVNGAAPAASYPPCADLQLSLGEITGDAMIVYDSRILWRVDQNGQSVVGMENVTEPTFTIPSAVLEADKTYEASVSIFGPYIRVQDIDINIVAGTCAPPPVEATESSTLLQVSLLMALILATIF